MKERPILFSADMVNAILAGVKTQTRRVVKPQPVIDADGKTAHMKGHGGPADYLIRDVAPRMWCPYGKPGYRLWVREAHYIGGDNFTAYRADMKGQFGRGEFFDFKPLPGHEPKWRPSIHMPRSYSRILLEIKAVRCERLQGISEDDARAEGIPNAPYAVRPDLSFRKLWEKINGEASWRENPFVWVLEFERVQP